MEGRASLTALEILCLMLLTYGKEEQGLAVSFYYKVKS